MRKPLSLILILLFSFAAYAQQNDLAVVYGMVKDSLGRSFADANVFVVGTNITTTSREDGSYQVKIPSNKEYEIAFTFVGSPSFKTTVGPLKPNERFLLDVTMSYVLNLKTFTYTEEQNREKASTITIDIKEIKYN